MTAVREGDGGKEAFRVSLRQKKYTVFGVILGIPVLLLLILAGLEGTGQDANEGMIAVLVLAEIAGIALHILWMRCPHCGTYLDRNGGQYCQHCGKEIDWDDRPGKE